MEIKASWIIVTGASDGIGKEIALDLATQKANLILIGRNTGNLKSVKAEAEKLGAVHVECYSVDISKPQAISDFAEELSKTHKYIDGIINNAGIWQHKANLDDIPEEEILAVINTNLTGMILLTRKVLPLLKKTQDAFIINISSRSGHFAAAGQVVYAASKYGVRGFTEVLHEDLKDSNIRVAGIYQGGVNTKMFDKAGDFFGAEKLSGFIPANELAKVVSYLISRPKGIWMPEIRIEKN